jgi:hypothetical protein
MPHTSIPIRSPLSLWSRLAVLLSFVAVLSALLAPAAMLAQEVQGGRFGGICSLKSSGTDTAAGSTLGAPDDGSSDADGSHCDLCGSMAKMLPLLALPVIPSLPESGVAATRLPAHTVPSITGLPFSRGPPLAC